MKKILFLALSGLLVLGACGNNEDSSNKNNESKAENKQHDQKEKTSEDKNKEDKKDKEESEDKENNKDESNQENIEEAPENENAQDNQNDEVQNEQVAEEEPQQDVQQEQAEQIEQPNEQDGEYNSKEHSQEYNNSHPVSTDDDMTPEELERLNQSHGENESNSDNPYLNMPNQEWRYNAGGLSSGEMQTRNEILNGTYEGDDGDQILEALDYYEQKYGN